MNAFFLMLTVFIVATGRLGDLCGRQRVLYLGVLVFAAASFLAGTAESAAFLVACRFAQGFAGAIALTCSVGLVTHRFLAQEQGRALAQFMGVTGFGMAVGPVLGGVLMSPLSWRWVFYMNLPVALLGFIIAWGAVRETPRRDQQRLDWLGVALLTTPGMGALVTVIMKGNNWGWYAPLTIALAIAAIVFLVAFVVAERRVRSPILDFALFRNPSLRLCTMVALILGGFIAVGSFMAPLYLQSVRDDAPDVAGLMLLPISGLVVIVPPLIGSLVDRVGPVPFLAIGQLVHSVLSDPSQAIQLLGRLTPGLEHENLPLFREAFTAGYGGAMWYLLITCAIGAAFVPLLARLARSAH